MGFPSKNDRFGVFWGYHHLRKHLYVRLFGRSSVKSQKNDVKYMSNRNQCLGVIIATNTTQFEVG